METLRLGSRGDQVKLLQRLLNKSASIRPSLVEDGIYGANTLIGLNQFKKSNQLPAGDLVNAAIWQLLGIRYDFTPRVMLVPQTSDTSCWSAAATMIVGNMSVSQGLGSLLPDGTMQADTIEAFVRGLGWHHFCYPMTWTVKGLAALLRRGPSYVFGGGFNAAGCWGHAFVLSAIWSDGDESGSGTMLRIHDPWPPNVGKVYCSFYRGTVDGFDFINFYVAQP